MRSERIPWAVLMATRRFPVIACALVALGVVSGMAGAAGLVRGEVGEPPSRPLGPPDEGKRLTPDYVIGRAPQARGHVEIASYGWLAPKDSGAPYRKQLCTWIEHVPGSTDFASCGSGAQMAEEGFPLRLEMHVEALGHKRTTEFGGMLLPEVATVEVRFHRRGRRKASHAAAIVTQVSGELQERLKQPDPFGYFFAQVKGLISQRVMTVLAFDEEGHLIDRVRSVTSPPIRLH